MSSGSVKTSTVACHDWQLDMGSGTPGAGLAFRCSRCKEYAKGDVREALALNERGVDEPWPGWRDLVQVATCNP